MFSHVIGDVNDLETSNRLYDALLGTLGIKPGIYMHNGIVGRYFYRVPTGSFGIFLPLNGEPATHDNGSTIGFTIGRTTCEEPPGWRDGSMGKLYLVYLRDPDGTKGRVSLTGTCTTPATTSTLAQHAAFRQTA